MKTEFLKNLGITEQSVIDQIMAENGRDVNAAKTELNNYKQQVTDLQGQITAKDNEIATLNTKVGEVETLRNENAQLKTDKTNLTTELNTKVTEIKKTYAIENGVRDAKARNVKAVIAQLDMSKITYENDALGGLTEQLEALKTGEDTSFLFGEAQVAAPAGTHVHTPPATGGKPQTSNSFAEAVAKAISKNN
jgi:chromosome segregation ATPase